MSSQEKERRRVCYSALVDNAIRSTNQLFATRDPNTRNSASRVLSDLQKLRAEIPQRRQDDEANSDDKK